MANTNRDLGTHAQDQRGAEISDAQLDIHLDAILRGAGSALRHYTVAKSKDDMRAALRRAVTELSSHV